MAIMMEGILRIYGLLFGGARDMDLDDEGDFVDMVEGNLEEDMELVQEENMRRRANAQEQVKRRGGRGRRTRGEIKLWYICYWHCGSTVHRNGEGGKREEEESKANGKEGLKGVE